MKTSSVGPLSSESADMSISTFFGPVLALQSAFDLQAALRNPDSVLEMPSFMKSGIGALDMRADIPIMNSMPMFMKCLWTSGSVTMPMKARAASSALDLP